MYGSQIEKLIRRDRILSRTFVGIFAKDKLPEVKKNAVKNLSYVFNSANSKSLGEHWLAVFVKPKEKKLIWFDSFNKQPLYYGPKMKKWVNSWGYTVETANKAVQAAHSHYCGLFVIFILYYLARGFQLSRIIKKFFTNLPRNDYVVSYFAWSKFRFNAKKEIKKYKNSLSDLYLILTNNYL